MNGVLPRALRRGRTRRPRGQGGSKARAAAPECCGAHSWWYGHIDPSAGWCEVAHGRCNGRSCTYSSGPETLVPLSPTHGPSVCTWRHYQTLKVTSVFNICRPGDAVVSGPHETGQYCIQAHSLQAHVQCDSCMHYHVHVSNHPRRVRQLEPCMLCRCLAYVRTPSAGCCMRVPQQSTKPPARLRLPSRNVHVSRVSPRAPGASPPSPGAVSRA